MDSGTMTKTKTPQTQHANWHRSKPPQIWHFPFLGLFTSCGFPTGVGHWELLGNELDTEPNPSLTTQPGSRWEGITQTSWGREWAELSPKSISALPLPWVTPTQAQVRSFTAMENISKFPELHRFPQPIHSSEPNLTLWVTQHLEFLLPSLQEKQSHGSIAFSTLPSPPQVISVPAQRNMNLSKMQLLPTALKIKKENINPPQIKRRTLSIDRCAEQEVAGGSRAGVPHGKEQDESWECEEGLFSPGSWLLLCEILLTSGFGQWFKFPGRM